MHDEKKAKPAKFFDVKRNLYQLFILLIAIAAGGWYFGYNSSDVGHVLSEVATVGRPALPVEVKYRQSVVGRGLVLILTNTGAKKMAVTLTVETSQGSKEKTDLVMLEPHRQSEFGWLQGWHLHHGDVVTLANSDYMTGTYSIR